MNKDLFDKMNGNRISHALLRVEYENSADISALLGSFEKPRKDLPFLVHELISFRVNDAFPSFLAFFRIPSFWLFLTLTLTIIIMENT